MWFHLPPPHTPRHIHRLRYQLLPIKQTNQHFLTAFLGVVLKGQPLQPYLDKEAIIRHTRPWQQVLMFFARTQKKHGWKSPPYQFRRRQREAWEALVEQAERDVEGEEVEGEEAEAERDVEGEEAEAERDVEGEEAEVEDGVEANDNIVIDELDDEQNPFKLTTKQELSKVDNEPKHEKHNKPKHEKLTPI